ncbi:hypothetical protein [Bacillus sp. JCM 19041]
MKNSGSIQHLLEEIQSPVIVGCFLDGFILELIREESLHFNVCETCDEKG